MGWSKLRFFVQTPHSKGVLRVDLSYDCGVRYPNTLCSMAFGVPKFIVVLFWGS